MKLSEIISQCDRIKPNTYDYSQKKRWVIKAESEVTSYAELYSDERFDTDFSKNSDPELFLPEKHSDIYLYYLISMIDLSNQEYMLYNNSVLYYNNVLLNWKKQYRKEHMPKCSITIKT